jgi:hypothetical protein
MEGQVMVKWRPWMDRLMHPYLCAVFEAGLVGWQYREVVDDMLQAVEWRACTPDPQVGEEAAVMFLTGYEMAQDGLR